MPSIDRSLNHGYILRLTVNVQSQSIANNTTTWSYVLQVIKTTGSGYWANGLAPWSVRTPLNNVIRYGSQNSYDFRNYTVLTLVSSTITISGSAARQWVGIFDDVPNGDLGRGQTAALTVTPPVIPTVPQNLRTTSVTTSSINLAWNAVSGATSYRFRYRLNGGAWVDGGTRPSNSATIGSPNAAAVYQIQVAATAGAGTSNWSSTLTVNPVPVTPNTGSVSRVSDARQNLSYGGAYGQNTPTSAVIQRRVNDGSWTTLTTSAGLSSYADTTTVSNRKYAYRVAYRNASGTSGYREIGTIYTTPAATGTPTATRSGSNVSVNTGSRPPYATSYDIENNGTVIATSVQLPWTHVGASQAITHRYRVRAKRGSLVGPWSAYSNTLPVTQAPNPPGSISVTRNSDTSHTVSWTAPSGGVTPTGAVLQRRRNDGSWTEVRRTTATGASSFTDTGTVANSKYVYRVAFLGAGGQSSWRTSSVVYTTPAAPGKPSATRPTSTTIRVDATRPPYASSYDIEDNGTVIATSVSLPWTHNSPDPMVTHRYRVRGKVGSRVGSWSAYSDIVTLLAPPNAPTNLSPNGGVIDFAGSFTLSWRHNPVDSSQQTQRQLRRRLVGASSWTESGQVTTSEQSVPVAGSWAGATGTYEWQVRTRGQHVNWSPWSATATFTTIDAPTAAVNQPVDGVPWESSTVTAVWAYDQLQSRPQDSWEAELVGPAGETETLNGTGPTDTVTFQTRAYPGDWTVRVRVASSDIWSAWAEQAFEIIFYPPVRPKIDGEWNDGTGAVDLDIQSFARPGDESLYRNYFQQPSFELETPSVAVRRNFVDRFYRNGFIADWEPYIVVYTNLFWNPEALMLPNPNADNRIELSGPVDYENSSEFPDFSYSGSALVCAWNAAGGKLHFKMSEALEPNTQYTLRFMLGIMEPDSWEIEIPGAVIDSIAHEDGPMADGSWVSRVVFTTEASGFSEAIISAAVDDPGGWAVMVADIDLYRGSYIRPWFSGRFREGDGNDDCLYPMWLGPGSAYGTGARSALCGFEIEGIDADAGVAVVADCNPSNPLIAGIRVFRIEESIGTGAEYPVPVSENATVNYYVQARTNAPSGNGGSGEIRAFQTASGSVKIADASEINSEELKQFVSPAISGSTAGSRFILPAPDEVGSANSYTLFGIISTEIPGVGWGDLGESLMGYFDSATPLNDEDFALVGHGPTGTSEIHANVITPDYAENCLAVRSNQWAKDGNYSMRLIPTGDPGDPSFVSFEILSGTFAAAGWAAATCYLAEPLTGAVDDKFLSLEVTEPSLKSDAAYNAEGETYLRVDWSDPRTSDPVNLIFHHGGGTDSGSVWWDFAMVSDATYAGPHFTGDTESVVVGDVGFRAKWLGTPNNSQSEIFAGAPGARIIVERSIDGGQTWEFVAELPPESEELNDFESLSCGDTMYRAIAYSIEDAPAESDTLTVRADSLANWLGGGINFANQARLPGDPGYDTKFGRRRATEEYKGRAVPVAYSSKNLTREIGVSGSILERNLDPIPGDGIPEADVARLEAVVYDEQPLHLYRDMQGRRIYGSLSLASLKRTGQFESCGQGCLNAVYSYTFSLTESDRGPRGGEDG